MGCKCWYFKIFQFLEINEITIQIFLGVKEDINLNLNQWIYFKNDVVRADTVGGESSENGIFDFHTIETIQPIPNFLILIDHSQFENIHAVLPCNSENNRLVIQQWLSIAD